MGTIIGILESLWSVVVGLFESILTAANMVVVSIDFVSFFVTFLPTVIASGVVIYLAVYIVRFLLLK